MQRRWTEESLREVVGDLIVDATLDTYSARIAEASADSGIPEAVIDNRFRREYGPPERALRRNAEISTLLAHASKALRELPAHIAQGSWAPCAGTIVDFGNAAYAFLGYDPFDGGKLYLIDSHGSLTRLDHDDPRATNVLKQAMSAFNTKIRSKR